MTDVVTRGESAGRKRSALPASFAFDGWHNVAVGVRGREMRAEVTDARLHDPLAEARRTLPRSLSEGKAGVVARGRADADNVSAARLYAPNTKTVPTPEVGEISPAHSDEFDGAALEPEWSFVREPDGQVAGGSLNWQTQEGDIVGTANDATVLLRDAPEGRYVVETRLTMENLGVEAVRNFQQGGMIAYARDDLWARLSHAAIFNTRQTEFGKEMPFADGLSFGGMLIGPPSGTTWMCLAHRVDPANGEHEFRAATSRDGRTFVWGGTWTLPADTEPRIGLHSLGRSPDDPAATSRFDYFRVYRPR